MLSQNEIKALLDMLKILDERRINFPEMGNYKQLDVVSKDGKEKFLIDINRKTSIKITKCTYQGRCRKDIVLLRLDIDGPPHTNPDGEEIHPNHLHIYKEGHGTSWAIPIPTDKFSDVKDLLKILIEFLEYFKVENLSDISVQGGMFDGIKT